MSVTRGFLRILDNGELSHAIPETFQQIKAAFNIRACDAPLLPLLHGSCRHLLLWQIL